IEGIETRMVGREAELKVLQEAFFTVVEDQQQQFVTIVAEPGLGKSRLLYEFDTWLELQPQEFLFFKGRAIPATQHRPYALLRDLFASHYQIQDSDPPAIVQAKLDRTIGATFGSGTDAQMKA